MKRACALIACAFFACESPSALPDASCSTSMQVVDAGVRWQHMQFVAEATAGQNVFVVQTGNRALVKFIDEGPFSFTTSNECGSVEWRGTAVSIPIVLPEQPLRPVTTRVGDITNFEFPITSRIDDELQLDVRPFGPPFVTYGNRPLAPRSTQNYRAHFEPKVPGPVSARLVVLISDWSTELAVEALAE